MLIIPTLLLFFLGNLMAQTINPTNNITYVNPNFGVNKCGLVGTDQPSKAADCNNDLRIASNTCCMLTLLINNKNFTLCDSVPTQFLIGTNYKQGAANQVAAKNYTFVDYDCGSLNLRPPVINILVLRWEAMNVVL